MSVTVTQTPMPRYVLQQVVCTITDTDLVTAATRKLLINELLLIIFHWLIINMSDNKLCKF